MALVRDGDGMPFVRRTGKGCPDTLAAAAISCSECSPRPALTHVSEKAVATHSSDLAWRIPGTGEPGGPPSMGSDKSRPRLE